MNKKLIFSVAITAMVIAPYLSRSNATLGGGEVPAMLQNAGGGSLGLDGIYTVTHSKHVKVKSFAIGNKKFGTQGDALSFNLETEAPVGVEHLENGDVRLTLAQPDDADETYPSSITVAAGELKGFDLAFKSSGGADQLQTAYEDFASQGDDNARRGGKVSLRRRKGYAVWGDGGCVNFLKQQTHCYKHLGNGPTAVYGLVKAGCGYHLAACQGIPGEVYQWSRGAGHVAIWNGSCYKTDVASACSMNHGDPDMGHPTACALPN